MLPADFVEYSKRFEVGFLCAVGDDGPDVRLVRFEITDDEVKIRGEGLPEGRACLAFANEEYVWKSENASVNGRLEKIDEGEYLLLPDKIVWTIGFEIGKRPQKIVKRWRR